jgi:hypothetical protein
MSRWARLVGRPETRHGFDPARHVVNRARAVPGPKVWHDGLGPAQSDSIFFYFFIKIHILYLNIEYTSRLPVRCDGLQQYPRKLSTKKSQDFLLIVSALRIIFFIWLTDVIVYSIQYVYVQYDQ